MEIILGIDHLRRPFVNPVVTLGNFDGVHLGHQKIFARIKEEASRVDGEAVVITFEPHPLQVLSPHRCPPLLTPFRKKMLLIEEFGIDTVLCIPFTAAFSQTSPLDFIKTVLIEKVGAKKIIVGFNYHFGKNKQGDVETLRTVGKSFHVDVDVMEPLILDGTVVSSSKIRAFLKAGHVETAAKLLGRDYSVIGNVVEGAKRGHRLLGFPTANLAISEEVVPKAGVYAVGVLWNRQPFNGVANLGVNPTFQPAHSEIKAKVSLEVYILDFNRNIYGDEIQVSFKKRIRDEVRFGTTADLIDQIQRDVQWAQENIFTKGVGQN
jgi:riboflavin kinase/FMN adenylyltransferase